MITIGIVKANDGLPVLIGKHGMLPVNSGAQVRDGEFTRLFRFIFHLIKAGRLCRVGGVGKKFLQARLVDDYIVNGMNFNFSIKNGLVGWA